MCVLKNQQEAEIDERKEMEQQNKQNGQQNAASGQQERSLVESLKKDDQDQQDGESTHILARTDSVSYQLYT